MKAFVSGIGVAVAAGLVMGAVMKPNLRDDDRPQGPQMFNAWGGARSTGPFDDGGASLAAWQGPPPAYVAGTDALKAASWLGPVAAPLPNRDLEPLPKLEPVKVADASLDAPPAAPSYPSVEGGAPGDPLPPATADAVRAQPYDQPLPG